MDDQYYFSAKSIEESFYKDIWVGLINCGTGKVGFGHFSGQNLIPFVDQFVADSNKLASGDAFRKALSAHGSERGYDDLNITFRKGKHRNISSYVVSHTLEILSSLTKVPLIKIVAIISQRYSIKGYGKQSPITASLISDSDNGFLKLSELKTKGIRKVFEAPVLENKKAGEKDTPKIAAETNHCQLLSKLIVSPNYIDYQRDGEINLSPRYHGRTLHGREADISYLNDFLEFDAPFRMLFVVAPSGAGKTRLATQWFHEHIESTNWQTGFVEEIEDNKAELSGKWRDWKDLEKHPITCDTVIIVDYIYRFKDIVRAVIDKGKQLNKTKTSDNTSENTQPSKTFPRLRLIILDHIYDETQLTTYQEDALGKDNETIAQSQTINHPPLYLKTSDDDLKKIIVDASKLSSDSPLIDQAFETLMQMDDATELATSDDKGRYSRQPLFALMIGMAIADANAEDRENITQWKRSELIEAYLDRTNRIPWDKSTGNDWESGTIVAAATALQGLKYSTIFRQHFSVLGTEKDRIISDCQYIISDNDTRFLKKYEPDIVGESFVLLFFKQFGDAEEHPAKTTFFNILNHQGDIDKNNLASVTLNDRFIEFIQRTSRNIINDEASHHDLEALAYLLNPSHYLNSDLMQLSISIAAVNVIKQLSEKADGVSKSFIKYFIEVVDFSFISSWFLALNTKKEIFRGNGSTWNELLSTMTIYVDLLMYRSALNYETEKQYQQCLIEYEEYSEAKKTRLLLPALNNTPFVLDWILKKDLEIDINQTDRFEQTVLMTACYLGHVGIVKILLNFESRGLNKQDVDNWNALMFACEKGHVSTVKYLLSFSDIHINEKNKNKSTAFMIACYRGHYEIVQLLLGFSRLKLNEKDIDGYSALTLATLKKHIKTINLLLNDDRIEVRKHGFNDQSALVIACKLGFDDVVRVFCDCEKFVLSIQEKSDLVELAINSNNFNVARFLLEKYFRSQFKFGLCSLLVNTERLKFNAISEFLGSYVGGRFKQSYLPIYTNDWIVLARRDTRLLNLMKRIASSKLNFILSKKGCYSIRVSTPKFYPSGTLVELLFYSSYPDNTVRPNYHSIILFFDENDVFLASEKILSTLNSNHLYPYLKLSEANILEYLQYVCSLKGVHDNYVFRCIPDLDELKGFFNGIIFNEVQEAKLSKFVSVVKLSENFIIKDCLALFNQSIYVCTFKVSFIGEVYLVDYDLAGIKVNCMVEKFHTGIRWFEKR